MPLKTEKPSEEKAATPLSILEQIFGKDFILQNQSQFTSKEGKVDFSKLKDFLTKQGYSEKFASEVAEGIKKGTLTLKDTLKYSQAAKNDLDLKTDTYMVNQTKFLLFFNLFLRRRKISEHKALKEVSGTIYIGGTYEKTFI